MPNFLRTTILKNICERLLLCTSPVSPTVLIVNIKTCTAQKMKETADLVTFTEEILNPFQPEAHICAPFSCYVILRHYLPIKLSYDRQIFMRDSGIAVLHIYSVCTVIEYTVVSIYYLKYQCWSRNIKTVNFEKANFIKQNSQF